MLNVVERAFVGRINVQEVFFSLSLFLSPFLYTIEFFFQGLRCMSKNETYAECQKNCPASWDCNKPQLDEWSQCGGAGFNGLTSCQGKLFN